MDIAILNKGILQRIYISLTNVTQGRILKWIYRQYREKIAQTFSILPLFGTPQKLGNDASPLPKERYYLGGVIPWSLKIAFLNKQQRKLKFVYVLKTKYSSSSVKCKIWQTRINDSICWSNEKINGRIIMWRSKTNIAKYYCKIIKLVNFIKTDYLNLNNLILI